MTTMMRHNNTQAISLIFTAVVCGISLFAWGDMNRWQLGTLTLYAIFPLLGLLAFSILWSQYIVLACARLAHIPVSSLSRYFSVTGWLFLGAIFLHPGLLVWQLWRDGFGLPPESYLKHYVAPGLEWAALLGSVSFLIFLSFELRRWYEDRPWWKFMTYATDIAALAIVIHGYKLGATLQQGWFQYVWLVYGATLLFALLWLRIYPLLRRSAG